MSFKKDLISGSCLLGFGVLLAGLASRFTIWESHNEPGPGFFPLGIAFLIIVLSLIVISQDFFRAKAAKPEPVTPSQKKTASPALRILGYCGAILLFGILIEKAGFLIVSAGLMGITLKLEKKSWKITLIVGAASVAVSYLLFKILLGVPLPQGFFRWI